MLDQLLELGLVFFFFLARHLIKILLLQIRCGSCCANVTQSKGEQREGGCLQIPDQERVLGADAAWGTLCKCSQQKRAIRLLREERLKSEAEFFPNVFFVFFFFPKTFSS